MQQGYFHMQSPNKKKVNPKPWTLNERDVMLAQSSWEIKAGPSKLDELTKKRQNVEKNTTVEWKSPEQTFFNEIEVKHGRKDYQNLLLMTEQIQLHKRS